MSLDDDFCVAIAHDGTIEGTTQHLDLKTRCYDDALQCERLEELKVHRMDAAWMADDPRLLAEWRRANAEINQDTVRAAVWRRSR